jgi:asparagine synthase (glutamine-hydrolysing)
MNFNCFINYRHSESEEVKGSFIDSSPIDLKSNKIHFTVHSKGLEKSFCLFYSKNRKTTLTKFDELIFSDPEVTEFEKMSFVLFKDYISTKQNSFSCALWFDEDSNELLIARDYFGSIPLYYVYFPSDFLAISTDIFYLLKLKKIVQRVKINPEKVNSYLSISDASKPYTSETFYSCIHNLLPSHITSFSCNTSETHLYAHYRPDKYYGLTTVEEYGQVFGDFLQKSVTRAVKNQKVIGCHLSGGLDSSSIVAAARSVDSSSNIHSFFFNIASPWSDERHYAQQVADYVKTNHHITNPHQKNLDYLIKNTALLGQPQFILTPSNVNELLIEHAASYNCDVLLTGHDGDSIVGYGKEYLNELFFAGNWNLLDYEISNQARFDHPATVNSTWGKIPLNRRKFLLLKNLFYRHLFLALREFSLADSLHILKISRTIFKISSFDLLRKVVATFIDKIVYIARVPSNVQSETLNKYLASYTNEILCSVEDHLSDPRTHPIRNILYNQNVRISEEYFALSKHFDINIRHPFFDPDLYELSLAVPSKLKFDHGLERGHQRAAMVGLLPETVRLRTNKSLYNHFTRLTTLSLIKQAQDFLISSNPIWEYVNKRNFDKSAKLLNDDNQAPNIHHITAFYINRTIFLSIWLDLLKRNQLYTT